MQFDGFQDEDPNAYIANSLEVCDTFKINGAIDDAIRLRLFPFFTEESSKVVVEFSLQRLHYYMDSYGRKVSDKLFSASKDCENEQ